MLYTQLAGEQFSLNWSLLYVVHVCVRLRYFILYVGMFNIIIYILLKEEKK